MYVSNLFDIFSFQKQIPQLIETIVPKDPPPAFEYIADPPTISAIDLYVFFLCSIASSI